MGFNVPVRFTHIIMNRLNQLQKYLQRRWWSIKHNWQRGSWCVDLQVALRCLLCMDDVVEAILMWDLIFFYLLRNMTYFCVICCGSQLDLTQKYCQKFHSTPLHNPIDQYLVDGMELQSDCQTGLDSQNQRSEQTLPAQ